MTDNAKIIASSILVGASTIGLTMNNNIFFPIIIGLIGVVLLINAWTGYSLRDHFKKVVSWAKDYDNLENRISEEEDSDESSDKKDV